MCAPMARGGDCRPDDSRCTREMIGVEASHARFRGGAASEHACRRSFPMASASPSSTRARASPVLLIHGFASSVQHQLDRARLGEPPHRNGYRVIAFDNRGHGESDKLYDRALYCAPLMAEDARRLLDHLAIPRPT